VSKHKRTKARGRKWREGRERGKGWSARVAIMAGLQREREEKRRVEEEMVNLAEFHLNFEKFKTWSKWWW
jgi:hypothetical protein